MRTVRELLNAMGQCKRRDKAARIVAEEVRDVMEHMPGLPREQAREAVLSNIGYLTGYCSRAEAGRLLVLFETRHPIFGAVEDWPESPEEILQIGIRMGRLARASAFGNDAPSQPGG